MKVAVPAGSRFEGYEDFLVQDVIVRAHVIRYHRERWLTPDGQTVIAPLPARGRRALRRGSGAARPVHWTQSEDSQCGRDVRVGAHGPDLEHPPQRR